MELPDTYERKKISIVLVVLLILAGGFFTIRYLREKELVRQMAQNQAASSPQTVSPTIEVPSGIYTISPSQSTIKSGEVLALTLQFEAPGKKLDGSDVFLRFDPVFLDIDENFTYGTYFMTYPRVTVDTVKGEVKVTGFRSSQVATVNQPTVFFVARFTGRQTGRTAVSFEYQEGRTNLTTLVEKGTSKNILSQVFPATITIE